MKRRIIATVGIATLLISGLIVVVNSAMADPVDLYDGLIAFWEMDELGMQYDAHSSSEYPQMYHLTNNNTVRSGTGKVLNACVFSEANGEYLSQYTADIGILPHFETGFTLSAWVWISDTATSPDMIIRRWDISGPEYLLYIENGVPRIDIYMHSGDTISATAATTVTTERWHLITAWYDDAALHIQLDNAATGSSAAPGFLNTEADSNFYISQPLSGGMEGKIDQVGMWDRPLTYAERSALWNGGYGLPYSSMDTWTPPTATPTPIPTATPTPLPIPQDTLLDGLVSYWKLDETSGTRYDSHGDNDLTDNNSVGYTSTAILNNAARFNAANNEYLSAPHSADLSPGDSDFSVSLWAAVEDMTHSSGLIRKGGSSGWEFMVFYSGSNEKFYFATYDGTSPEYRHHPQAVLPGNYYHIIVWHDASQAEIKIQIDGEIYTDSVDTIYSGSGNLYIGGIINYADALIDEVGLWNRVLTPAERDALYHHTLEGLPPGTHHYGLPYADFGDYPKSAINVYVVNAQLTPVPIEKIGTYYADTFGNPATEWQESQVSAPNDWISAYGGCSNCSATELWPDWRLVPQPSRLGAAIRTYSDTQQIVQAYTMIPDGNITLGSDHYTATTNWNTPFTRHAITFVVGTAQTIQINTTGETPAHIGYGIWDASGLRDSGYECHDAASCEIRLYPQTSDLYAGALIYLDEGQSIASVTPDPADGAQTGGSGYYYLRWPIWSGGYHTATVGISAATPTPTATPTETPTPTPESTRRPTLTPTPYTTGTPLPTTTPTPMGTATPFFTSTLTPIPTKMVTTTGDITYTGPLSFSWSSTESGLNGVMIDTGSIMGSVLGEATDVISLTNQDNALWVMAALSMALLVLAWAIDTVKNPR